MPPKAKANLKAVAKAPDPTEDVDRTSKWGFDKLDKDGNLRTRGQFQQVGEYANLGSINDLGAVTGSAGVVYTLTSSAAVTFNYVSGNFRPVLWDEGEAAGLCTPSPAPAFRVEAFTRCGPEHVGILDGHARRGSD